MVRQKKPKARKHVLRQETTDRGRKSWVLLDPAGHPIEGYTLFMRSLLKAEVSLSTRRSYSLAISQFYDYLFEVALLYAGLTEDLLEDACDAYEVYMIKGLLADDELAKEVAESLPSPKLAATSYDVHHSAMQRFLRCSAKWAKHANQLAKAGFDTRGEQRSELPLFDTGRRELSPSEHKQRLAKSVLAATMHGGARMGKTNVINRRFPSSKTKNKGDVNIFDEEAEQRTFPWDRIQDLLDNAPNPRARTLWALIAATGCRISEAISILNSDIDVKNRSIQLVAARERPLMYPYLNAEQLEELSFKTRDTRSTFMISWGKQFFDSLLEYRRSDDYRIAVKHDFVFQSMHADSIGQPQVFHSYQSMLDTFRTAVKKVLGDGDISHYGFHSLRHAYGFYLKNYAPRADGGYGFALETVQVYMGHASPESTKKYALDVKEKLELQLVYANKASITRAGTKTLFDLKLERNRKEYEQLMAIAKERQLTVDKRFNGVLLDD